MGLAIPASLKGLSVAIIGMGHSAAPALADAFTGHVWTINEAKAANCSMIIAMDDLRRDKVTHPDYVEQLVARAAPLVTTNHYPEYPTTLAYPLREVIDSVFDGDESIASRCLKNTCGYALALAVCKQANEIFLIGFDFCAPDKKLLLDNAWPDRIKLNDPSWFKYYDKEVIKNRWHREPGEAGVNFLLGLAFARKIDVNIYDNSTLLDSDRPDFFYGYQEQPKL